MGPREGIEVELVSLEEAANILQRPQVTIRRLIELGELQSQGEMITVQALAEYVQRPFRPKVGRREHTFARKDVDHERSNVL